MADIGISIVEKLIESIGSKVIKEVCDIWGYKSQLEELKETVSTIRQVLLDAEAKRELSNKERDYIKKLKDAVYDADDLFDEFLTLAELKQLRPLTKHGRFFEKVRCFFSSKNQVGQAYRMSRDVKEVKKKLGAIADGHQKFGFTVDYKPISRRRKETCSYVDATEIIGREKDKEAIVGMLLDYDEGLRVVTIVGVGGLGKTTLAQLVYNDDRIKKEFPDLRLWVCISDQDGVPFDVKTILCKILEVVGHQKFDGRSTMELVQHRFHKSLRGKKYLLVLDDVWNEDRDKWLDLKKFLMSGQGGCRVVVTTRSKMTGTIIGDSHVHELQGLSPENSWLLFKMSAFHNEGDKPENYHDFVEMGNKIVAKCYNIPLAIKVVGSLLFGQGISKWRSFEDTALAEIGNGDNEILSILKLSYHNLAPSLKNCFSYCALFHKDERIEKQRLIDLWMAQGYIITLDGHQDIEDAAEEHFLILLRRCFFQDVKNDEYDNIESVKIHDLIHDVAQEVGREEIRVVTCNTMNLGETVRHVRYDSDDVLECPLGSSKMRSFIFQRQRVWEQYLLRGKNLDSWRCLRVLEMASVGVKKLPESIGNLLHLRYLDLSKSHSLEVLPDAIIRVHNLQTLLLNDCLNLRELPEDFCKLIKLRHLDLRNCWALTSMPWGMNRLAHLSVLPYYVVRNTNNKGAVTGADSGLKALKALSGLRGKMEIVIGDDYKEGTSSEREGLRGEYLKGMKHLTGVEIRFERRCDSNQEGVLENLQPPSNVKELTIFSYRGKRIPKWGRAVDNWASSLLRLVYLKLDGCVNLKEMPVLSKLPLLKSLYLNDLHPLEYMEMEITSSEDELFFPSLVFLQIWGLKKLKGWWKEKLSGVGDDQHNCCSHNRWTLGFPCLSELNIIHCPNMASFPPCPTIERLQLKASSVMRLQINQSDDNTVGSPEGNNVKKLRHLHIDNIIHLNSLPMHWLISLKILGDERVESLSEEIQKCASSLRSLWLCQCEMKSLPVGMQCLNSLQILKIESCKKLEVLPEWISCLSSLHSLTIYECPALKSLPQAMTKLTSLQRLQIIFCPALKERCKDPDGEDRPKIQHTPNIYIAP